MIEEKTKRVSTNNVEAYPLKMAIDGYIIRIGY